MSSSQSLHPLAIVECSSGEAPLPEKSQTRSGAHAVDTRSAIAMADEMASLYALSLFRDIPFRLLADPDGVPPSDGAPPFTLHAILSELRRLTPPGARSAPAAGGVSGNGCPVSLPGAQGEGLSVAELLAQVGRGSPGCLSGLWSRIAMPLPKAANASADEPGAGAPMSAWLRWSEHRFGAGLRLPGRESVPEPRSVTELAARVVRADPGQPMIAVALHLLAQGVSLRIESPQRLMELLTRIGLRAAPKAPALRAGRDRPTVVAARLTLLKAGEPAETMPDGATLAEALRRLEAEAPRLMRAVAARNARATLSATLADRDGERRAGWSPVPLAEMLTLPPLTVQSRRIAPGAATAHTIVAAAQAQVLMQLMELGPGGGEVMRLLRDVALACAATGGTWSHETAAAMLRGRAFAAAVLAREAEGHDLPPAHAPSGVSAQRLRRV